MEDKHLLMIPGPTPVPEKVLLAMAKRPIGHRSGDFSKIIAEINDGLKWLHQTQNEVLSLNVSGTGAMEAGMINFLSPGDRVLVGVNGKFGDRWAQICEVFGLDTVRISAEWGQPLDTEEIRSHLEGDSNKEIKAVVITHSETSTGVLNDLETISKHIKAHGTALSIVDAVTSLGAYNVPIDDWGLDVVASGSQKGYMIPPGLGFICVSDKAWKAYETCKFPRFYMDLGKYKKANQKASTPFTPPVNLMYGLQESLQMMQREGLESIFSRHMRLTKAVRAAVEGLGLKLFAADDCASTAVTAIDPAPVNINAEDIRKIMKDKYGISLAGGQDHLKGKIFRIGHLGFVSDRDMLMGIACLEATLNELGHDVKPQAGVKAAAAVMA